MPTETHKLYWQILPYLRGELDSEAERALEAAARENADLANEITFQRKLRDQPVEPIAGPSWDAFEAALDREQSAVVSNDLARADNQSADPSSSPALWRVAAIALGVVAIGQAGVLGWSVAQPEDEARYLTASSETAGAITMKLGFTEQATEGQMRALLQENDAVIVNGPSALGLYTISFGSKADCLSGFDAMAQHSVVDTATPCE